MSGSWQSWDTTSTAGSNISLQGCWSQFYPEETHPEKPQSSPPKSQQAIPHCLHPIVGKQAEGKQSYEPLSLLLCPEEIGAGMRLEQPHGPETLWWCPTSRMGQPLSFPWTRRGGTSCCSSPLLPTQLQRLATTGLFSRYAKWKFVFLLLF